MSETTNTLFTNRWKPTEYIHIEAGHLTAGPIQPGWLSARWQIEPVSGTSYLRFRSLWKPDNYLHIESGVPEAGPVGPGWLSAQWQFEPVPGTPFVRIRSRWPLVRYAHIESGRIDIGRVEPGWLSVQWLMERVRGTSFVRLRNRWKPDQCLTIESGVLSMDPAGPGWLSAQWSVEEVPGTSYVRFKNRWKPDQYFHIENGRPEAGPVGPGWLSAQWLAEKVEGTNFVQLRNRWDLEPYLHIQRGVLEAGAIEPGWLSAQWLTTALLSKTIPLELFQRKFDEFVNRRERPLFKFRLHGSELATFFEDPVDGVLKQFGTPVDLRNDGEDLEIDLDLPGPGDPLPNPNYRFNDLNTDRVTLNVTSDPDGSRPRIEARIDFETKGEELKINNFPNVDFTGLHLVLKLPFRLDAANGLVELAADEESVIADASVDVAGIPDGVVAREIESKLNEKVLKALQDRLQDQSESGWTPWANVSEGSTVPGGHVSAVVTANGRIALFLADPNGGVYTASGNPESGWTPWASVSEGSTVPGGHVSAVATANGRITLFLADPNGGVYTASGNPESGWTPWASVSEGSTVPGGHVSAVVTVSDRIALFLADPNGGVFASGEGDILRRGINRRLTRLLLGGDFRVVGVSSGGQALQVDYLVGSRLEPFPENPQPPMDPGLLSNIDHIVVLMMENRSFDHMLGYLSRHGGRNDVDGLRGGEKNPYQGHDYPSFPLTDTQFSEGPCHDFDCVSTQVGGNTMNGFVADFAARFEGKGVDPGKVMGYYQAGQLPVYDALAREFLLCQRWFCSHPGPTFPNRFYGLTGRLNRDAKGRFELDNPDFHNLAPVFTRTIFDHLIDQGVSWHYYEHGYCFLRLFERYTFDDEYIVDARDPDVGFFAAAQAGTLPSVSFIDPDFIDVPPGNDDHPPADVAAGQHLIGEVVNALMKGPLWSKTLLVITYDEHGGFFDHVPPPPAPAVSGIDRYGPRVPTFVISPWVDRGKVTDVVLDHTSILKTIARRFLSARPPDLGERVAQANDLSMVLRSEARQDVPVIPAPPAPAPSAAFDRQAQLAGESDRSFHKLLRSMRYLFFVE